mmetsp:Transcript_65375/g.156308  ORF Transcript_65375/g.156308 Transcript_65375/m.156308 type:complete len:245 (-) Transcript_65375:85-819(-)|eukprot:CAMPEP_0178420490 /NCGR_PEP_ID=MMETSP0689_2-20121128/26157_1 /TAXON_ID=160604 /ORGANISM="Amphidinium massartii, Strain CS-259" /LENGTH=244 /DNA_ID=CAMNT_0020041969 /DNA_START=128 /DNA_END=862 /DNA_ORIENTATION=-
MSSSGGSCSSAEDGHRGALEARIKELEDEVAMHKAQSVRLREMLQDSVKREAVAYQGLEAMERSNSRQVTHTFEDSDSEESVSPATADRAARDLESSYDALPSARGPRSEAFWDHHVRNLENLANQIRESQDFQSWRTPPEAAHGEPPSSQCRDGAKEIQEPSTPEVSTAPSCSSTSSDAPDVPASGDEEAAASSQNSTPCSDRRRRQPASPARPSAQDLLGVNVGLFSGCRLMQMHGGSLPMQ